MKTDLSLFHIYNVLGRGGNSACVANVSDLKKLSLVKRVISMLGGESSILAHRNTSAQGGRHCAWGRGRGGEQGWCNLESQQMPSLVQRLYTIF